MVHKAQQEYPELNASDAIQREANKGPGREAPPGPQDPESDKSMPQRAKESMQVNQSYQLSFNRDIAFIRTMACVQFLKFRMNDCDRSVGTGCCRDLLKQ